MKPHIPVLILTIIFAGGCIGLPTDIFGSDVLNVQQNVLQGGVKDALIIKDSFTIPRPPLLPDTQTILSFTLENQDKLKEAENVFVNLFDAPTFKDAQTRESCNAAAQSLAACKPNICGASSACSLLPGEQKQVNFYLKTPTQDEIAGIQTQASLNYLVNYDFEGSLSYIVPVVNLQEVIKRQRTNEKTTISVSKSHSSGPIQIDVELQGAPYMLAGDSPQEAVFLFKILNHGSGNLKDSAVESVESFNVFAQQDKGMTIQFPSDFEILEWPGCQKATFGGCTINQEGLFICDKSTNICLNNKDIDVFKDESRTSLRFKVKLSDVANSNFKFQGVPFRSYEIIARVGYTYELRNSVQVTINPFQNV